MTVPLHAALLCAAFWAAVLLYRGAHPFRFVAGLAAGATCAHLGWAALHWTEVPGQAPATTPLFLGAEPRIVPEGWPGAGTQALREEEEGARALYASLDPAQRARARLPYASGRALLLSDERQPERPRALGLPRGAMGPEQRVALDRLIDVYVDIFAPAVAGQRRREIDAAGRDAIHFAWTDAETPPHAFYYRIQGPSFLIELDNTGDGDHLHAVWRDFDADWGADLLALHYERAHGIRLAAERARIIRP